MKNNLVLLFVLFAISYANAQKSQYYADSKIGTTDTHDPLIAGVTLNESSDTSNLMWDTVTIYNTYDEILYREIRIFNSNGKTQVDLSENQKRTFRYDQFGNKVFELSEIRLMDSIWAINYRDTYTYNPNGKVLSYLREIFKDNVWVKSACSDYTYDAQWRLLTKQIKVWLTISWTDISIYSYSFDSDGKLLTELFKHLKNNLLVDYHIYTYTYDIYGNRLTDLSEYFIEDEMVENISYIYTYDTNVNMLSKIFKHLKDNALVDYHSYFYTYDDAGYQITILHRIWLNNEWVDNNRETYTYDIHGNTLTGSTEYRLVDDIWIRDHQYTYSYNDDGKILSETDNNNRYTYTYNQNGKLLVKLHEMLQSGIWASQDRITYTYDANGKVTSKSSETLEYNLWPPNYVWVGHYENYTFDNKENLITVLSKSTQRTGPRGHVMSVTTRYTYTYDINGNLLTGKYEEQSGIDWVPFHTTYFNGDILAFHGIVKTPPVPFILKDYSWENSIYRFVASYTSLSTITSVKTIFDKEKNSILVFPNPSSEKISIDLNSGGNLQKTKISIYDLIGNLVFQDYSWQEKTEVNIEKYNKGIYIIKISNNSNTTIRKLIKN